MYANAQYYNDLEGKQAGIKVEINGFESFVPIDQANSDYKNIMDLVAQGKLTIAPAS
jgi:hypothetical protein